MHGHPKKRIGSVRGRLSSGVRGQSRAASVNKGQQGLRRRSSRALGQAGRLQAGLPRGGPRPLIAKARPIIGRLGRETGTLDRRLQTRTGRREPASLKSALTRGKTRPIASSVSRRPAKGTVDRTLELRRAKTIRLRKIGATRNR